MVLNLALTTGVSFEDSSGALDDWAPAWGLGQWQEEWSVSGVDSQTCSAEKFPAASARGVFA